MSSMLPEVIEHPHKAPIFLVRVDYIHMCQGAPHPGAAGFILSLIEYWTRVKSANRNQAETANSLTDEPTQDTSLWVYKTEKELQDETLGLFGEKRLRANREWLIEQGFLFKRNNPKVPGDRTLQFHLGFSAIKKALARLSYDPDHRAELPHDRAELPHDRAELPHDRAELPDHIQRLTTETTPETTTETTKPNDLRSDERTPPSAAPASPLTEKQEQKSAAESAKHRSPPNIDRGIPVGDEEKGVEPPTALGKFIVGFNGRTPHLKPTHIGQIDKFYDVYVDGVVKKINPSTLYDEDPYFQKYALRVATDLKRQQQRTRRKLPPSRDRIIKALLNDRSTRLEEFFKWRKETVDREKADAAYKVEVYVDPEEAAFRAEMEAIQNMTEEELAAYMEERKELGFE